MARYGKEKVNAASPAVRLACACRVVFLREAAVVAGCIIVVEGDPARRAMCWHDALVPASALLRGLRLTSARTPRVRCEGDGESVDQVGRGREQYQSPIMSARAPSARSQALSAASAISDTDSAALGCPFRCASAAAKWSCQIAAIPSRARSSNATVSARVRRVMRANLCEEVLKL
jgi:hypothetical protein